jgi:hypothetical protein
LLFSRQSGSGAFWAHYPDRFEMRTWAKDEQGELVGPDFDEGNTNSQKRTIAYDFLEAELPDWRLWIDR